MTARETGIAFGYGLGIIDARKPLRCSECGQRGARMVRLRGSIEAARRFLWFARARGQPRGARTSPRRVRPEVGRRRRGPVRPVRQIRTEPILDLSSVGWRAAHGQTFERVSRALNVRQPAFRIIIPHEVPQ